MSMVFHMFSMAIPWKAVKYSGPERSTRGIRIVSIYGQQWTNTKRSARRDQLMSSAICGPPRNAQNAVARMSRVTFGPSATTPNGRYICRVIKFVIRRTYCGMRACRCRFDSSQTPRPCKILMYYEKHPHLQWRQRECNFGGDTEGIKEQLQR